MNLKRGGALKKSIWGAGDAHGSGTLQWRCGICVGYVRESFMEEATFCSISRHVQGGAEWE